MIIIHIRQKLICIISEKIPSLLLLLLWCRFFLYPLLHQICNHIKEKERGKDNRVRVISIRWRYMTNPNFSIEAPYCR